eukprot:gb/GECG01012088.1/.p1 GENE.gb/GECG01012088.1/~~gb/GECG01012088.1/.p1  ORF type:complete len:843 (+),score=124.86 gb/GECG01012088.1/:1-2529(+)
MAADRLRRQIEAELKHYTSHKLKKPDLAARHSSDLREKIVKFICNHYGEAKKAKADAKLWNLCHSIIKAFREKIKRIADENDPDRQDVFVSAFTSFLDECARHYEKLITQFKSEVNSAMESGAHSGNGSNAASPGVSDKSWDLHSSLIYMGDLMRYRLEVMRTSPESSMSQDMEKWSNWAVYFYRQAAILKPQSGRANNQIGVIASLNDKEIIALYQHCRSIMAEEPFLQARENIKHIIDRNRTRVADQENRPEFRRLASTAMKGLVEPKKASKAVKDRIAKARTMIFNWVLDRFVRCAGMVITRTSLEQLPKMLHVTGRDMSRLMRANAIPKIVLLQMLGIGISAVHDVGEKSDEYQPENENEVKRREIHKSYALLILMEIGAVIGQHLLREVSFFAKQKHGGRRGDSSNLSTEDLRKRIFQTVLEFSAPLGVLADWLRLNPSVLHGAVDVKPRIVEAKNQETKANKGRDKKRAIHGDFGDITFLASQGRRRVLDALAALANRLNDNADSLIGEEAEGTEQTEDTDLAGAVAEAALDDEDVDMQVGGMIALPEEQEFRGFKPLQGNYNNMLLPGSLPGQVFLGEMPGGDSHQRPVVPLTEKESFERRCGKVMRLVKQLAEDSECVLQRNPSTGRYMTQPKIELLKPTEGHKAKQQVDADEENAGSRAGRTTSGHDSARESLEKPDYSEEFGVGEQENGSEQRTTSEELDLSPHLSATEIPLVGQDQWYGDHNGEHPDVVENSEGYTGDSEMPANLGYTLGPLSGYVQQDLNTPSVMFSNVMGMLSNGSQVPSASALGTSYNYGVESVGDYSASAAASGNAAWAQTPIGGYFAPFYQYGEEG